MKFLIVNADDFGYSRGINRGIVEAHERGVVTSTGLMVNVPASEEAAHLAAAIPDLSVGLHVNFTNEAQRLVEFDDPRVCRTELWRQLDRFVELVGRMPSHLDSHQHVHRDGRRLPHFRELAEEHALPLRDSPPITYKGGFYAQWEYGVSDASKVTLEALAKILRHEVRDGVTELGCHPGYYDSAAKLVYHRDRELELGTLCDPRLRELLEEQRIRLISYHQLSEALSEVVHGR